MSDIDLLVPQTDVAKVAQLLSDLGYQPITPVALEAQLAISHHLPSFVKTGSVITELEIHWTLTYPA